MNMWYCNVSDVRRLHICVLCTGDVSEDDCYGCLRQRHLPGWLMEPAWLLHRPSRVTTINKIYLHTYYTITLCYTAVTLSCNTLLLILMFPTFFLHRSQIKVVFTTDRENLSYKVLGPFTSLKLYINLTYFTVLLHTLKFCILLRNSN